MKNLINWMCLISIMFLVIQIMIHISCELINDINKINASSSKKKVNRKPTANTNVRRKIV